MDCPMCESMMETEDYREEYYNMFEDGDKITQRWDYKCPVCHYARTYYKVFALVEEGWE